MRISLTLIALMLMLSVSAFAQVIAVPNAMQFQARLARPDGTSVPDGTYSVRFSLHTALTGGTEKWNQTLNVTTKNGNFATLLTGFPAGTFNGDLFLEMKIGTDAPLTPRQPLASVAYAMKADSVKDGSITSASIADGTLTAADFALNALNPLAWLLGGNSNPPPDSFLGTTTDFALELRTNNRRAMEYRYAENTATPAGQEYRSINVLGGSSVNEIAFGVVGATIAGGGKDYFSLTDGPNRVTAEFGTIGGGLRNSVGHSAGVVGGGENNAANGAYSIIGGGQDNTTGIDPLGIQGQYATVGGGYFNRATGTGSTVPGGFRVSAGGRTAFAAGYRANASHHGSFVWGDQTEQDLFSTGDNQFIIRANGGVGINKNNPAAGTLDVNGSGYFSGWVGVGTNAPQGALHIKGFQGALNLEGTTQHVYMQFFPRGFAEGRKAYIGFPAAGSHDLNIANEDGGAVRVVGTFVNNSDARYKKNITSLDNALESILNLRGVSYDWRQDMPGQKFTEQRQIGFLAQEVEKVLPELVYTDTNGYKSVAYVNVVPVLVEAVKTLKTQKDAEINALKTEVAELKALVQQLAEQQKAGQK